MARHFENRTVIVTGAAGGIGRACVLRFAEEGANVVLADRDPSKGAPVAEEARAAGAAGAWSAACDVTDETQVEACVRGAVERFGGLHAVVNNAGLMLFKPIDEWTGEEWNRVLGVDLLGAFYFLKHAFKVMPSGGAIVNVASVHAAMTTANVAPYAAAKAAMLSLTRSGSIEGKPRGIRVNAVLPGAVDTPMLWENPNLKSGAEKLDPADVGKPEDLAAAVAFLCAEEAAFVTGACLNVDGGRLAHL